MEKGVKYLVMVTKANNNKYYKMIPKGDIFTVEFGRLGGGTPQTATYPISQFDRKYNEKVRKGYEDKTDLVKEVIEETDADGDLYAPISDAAVRKIVDRLQSMAKSKIDENYRVSSSAVTQKMVDEAQSLVDSLVDISGVSAFNDALLELFAVLPRKMSNVNAYLAVKTDDFADIIKREQSLLDVMRGQVVTVSAKKDDDAKNSKKGAVSDKTILDTVGIKMEPVTDDEAKHIKEMLGILSGKYVNAWKVTNTATQEAFDRRMKETGGKKEVKELWHGSRNENWWSILTTGLMLRPTNAIINGKMFGYGLYFANKAAKSAGYMSTTGARWAGGGSRTGFLAVFDVIYGDPYIVDKSYYSYSGLGSMNYESLQKRQKGADSLHAIKGKTGLREDEIIIYRQDQATVKYLVEVAA